MKGQSFWERWQCRVSAVEKLVRIQAWWCHLYPWIQGAWSLTTSWIDRYASQLFLHFAQTNLCTFSITLSLKSPNSHHFSLFEVRLLEGCSIFRGGALLAFILCVSPLLSSIPWRWSSVQRERETNQRNRSMVYESLLTNSRKALLLGVSIMDRFDLKS